MGGRRRAPSPPQLQAPREVPLSETFARFLGQEEQIPALTAFADRLNRQFRQTLETGLPGTLGATTQVSKLVNELLGGAIPADVQSEVQRTAAQRNLAVGLPGTSEAARFLEARDFGATSLGLMEQGAAYTPGLLQMSEFLSPQQVQNYLFSTGQIRGEQLKQAQDQANVANQNAINRYNYDVANARSSGGFLGSLGGLLGGVAGSFIAPGIGTALGSAIGGGIGSAIGGGGFQLGAGQAGGLISPLAGLGSSLFGGGLLGGGGGTLGVPGIGAAGISSTAFSPIGQAFSVPSSSYGAPPYTGNMVYDYLQPSVPLNFGNGGMMGIRGF